MTHPGVGDAGWGTPLGDGVRGVTSEEQWAGQQSAEREVVPTAV